MQNIHLLAYSFLKNLMGYYDKEIIEKKTNYTCVVHFASCSVWGHVTMGRDPVTS